MGVHGERFVAAFGNGGQRLFVLPGLDFVLSVVRGGPLSLDDAGQLRAVGGALVEGLPANTAFAHAAGNNCPA